MNPSPEVQKIKELLRIDMPRVECFFILENKENDKEQIHFLIFGRRVYEFETNTGELNLKRELSNYAHQFCIEKGKKAGIQDLKETISGHLKNKPGWKAKYIRKDLR